MPDILLRSGELYVEKLRAKLEEPFYAGVTQRIFPSLDESDGDLIKQLIHSLLDLIPKLGAVIIDKDNLPDDRSLSALVFIYLIMPFDILPAEKYDLLGYLDDALVAHILIGKITDVNDSVTAHARSHDKTVADLMTRLPEWFTEAVTQFTSQAKEQRCLLQNVVFVNSTKEKL